MFPEHFLILETFPHLSGKCLEFHLKIFEIVFSKPQYSCTDEHFQQKLVFEKNYAFCHFSTLVKKNRAFQGKLSAWLSKLPSTYVNNSLFWGERKFPKIFLYHFRFTAENVLIFSEVIFWTVVETAIYISSAPLWCLFWKFLFFRPFMSLSNKC